MTEYDGFKLERDDPRGVATITLDVPGKLNRAQRDLFEKLREVLPVENEPAEKGLFEKVKDYFM